MISIKPKYILFLFILSILIEILFVYFFNFDFKMVREKHESSYINSFLILFPSLIFITYLLIYVFHDVIGDDDYIKYYIKSNNYEALNNFLIKSKIHKGDFSYNTTIMRYILEEENISLIIHFLKDYNIEMDFMIHSYLSSCKVNDKIKLALYRNEDFNQKILHFDKNLHSDLKGLILKDKIDTF
jgi:hypothetical protein